MAGTIFSLALSQRFRSDGKPEINAPVYVYAANTFTPADAYQDFGLSLKHTWPMRTDSNGMIPAFWLPDGQYRVRMTNAAASLIYFDMPNVQTVGPSSGTGGGGGGVDPNAIFQTGDELWVKRSAVRSGWVRQNGRTIGSLASGATERANADTQPLYEYIWNTFADTLCPVTGGRGASAAADYSANKPIGTPDMRGYGPMGLDDMGNTAAGRIVDGTPTVAGSSGGSEKRTISQANLPNVNLTGTTSSNGDHVHSLNDIMVSNAIAGAVRGADIGVAHAVSPWHLTLSSGVHAHTVTVALGGSGTPLNTMSPYRLGTWYIKL